MGNSGLFVQLLVSLNGYHSVEGETKTWN